MHACRYAVALIAMFACSGCAWLAAGSPHDRPSAERPRPAAPEPVLVEHGGLFACDVGGTTVSCVGPSVGVRREVVLDDAAIVAWLPEGWTGSYAGYAAWFQFGDDSRARVVVYPVADHHDEIARWMARDEEDTDVAVRDVRAIGSSLREPYLYRYRRAPDGRTGVVYALRSPEGRPMLVHGSWPEELDRTLLPVALAAANCTEIVPVR